MERLRVVADDGVALDTVVQGEGPGLLMAHGFGGAKEDFSGCLGVFSATHRAVAFDHRGHGGSDKPDGEEWYSLRRLARDVVCVADALGLDRFRLLGISMGGMAAQHVVLDHPDRVEALVLAGTCPGPVPGVEPDTAERAAAIALAEGLPELKRRMDADGGDPVGTAAHQRLLAERPGYREYGDRKFLAQSAHMYAAVLREMVRREDLSAGLAAVACPTLVVVGEQDGVFLDACRALAGLVPGARLAVVEDAGHSPQFEAPAAFFAAVGEFLGGLG